MATFSSGSQQSLTPQDVDAWLLAAAERRAALHRKAASPWPSHYLQDVVTEMSDLVQLCGEVNYVARRAYSRSREVRGGTCYQ